MKCSVRFQAHSQQSHFCRLLNSYWKYKTILKPNFWLVSHIFHWSTSALIQQDKTQNIECATGNNIYFHDTCIYMSNSVALLYLCCKHVYRISSFWLTKTLFIIYYSLYVQWCIFHKFAANTMPWPRYKLLLTYCIHTTLKTNK